MNATANNLLSSFIRGLFVAIAIAIFIIFTGFISVFLSQLSTPAYFSSLSACPTPCPCPGPCNGSSGQRFWSSTMRKCVLCGGR
jgi:hypothetical protein